jgi:thioredoxin-like negative regulator of GroEL
LILLDPHCVQRQEFTDMLASVVATAGVPLQIVTLGPETAADLACRYGVSRIPALIFLRNGNPIGHFAGYASNSAVQAWLHFALYGGVAPPALRGHSQPYRAMAAQAIKVGFSAAETL